MTLAAKDAVSVGHQPVERRADQEGSAVVLLQHAYSVERQHPPGHVLQQERRRPHQVALRAGLQPSGRERQLRRARINPTLRLTAQVSPREQVEHVLGSRAAFRLSDRAADRRHHRADGGRAGNRHGRGRHRLEQGTYARMEQVRWTSHDDRPAAARGRRVGRISRTGTAASGRATIATLIPVTEQCTAGCPTNGNIQGLVYRAQNWNTDFMEPIRWNASATYVTGAHNMKAGYIGAYYWDTSRPSTNNHNLAYRFNNGVPNQITENPDVRTRPTRASG